MRRLMRWELALAGVVLVTQTVSGQTVNAPQGWPGATPQPAPAVEPAPKTPAPRPAQKKAKPRPAVKVVAAAKPAVTEDAVMLAPPPAPAPAPAPAAPESATVVPRAEIDIVAALQQQSEVLSRLAAELDASRAVVAEQGRIIAALE